MEKCLCLTHFKIKKIYLSNMHKIRGAHPQCVNNYYAEFEYQGMKKFEFQITQIRHHKNIFDVKVQHPAKMKKKQSCNVPKIGGAHLQ